MTTAIQDRNEASTSEKRRRPVSIEIAEDDLHGLWLHLNGRWRKANSMDNLWEITEEWWDGRPVIKMYFRVTTEDRSQIIVFRDLLDGTWYREGFGEEGTSEGAEQPTPQTSQQAAPKTAKIEPGEA